MKERKFQTKLDALLVTVHYEYKPYEPPEDPDNLKDAEDEDHGRKAEVKIISVLSENGQDITDTLKDTEVRHLKEKCFFDVAKG